MIKEQKSKLDALKKSMDEAFRYLSQIPVSGKNVDLLALAREKLRVAYQLAGELETAANKPVEDSDG